MGAAGGRARFVLSGAAWGQLPSGGPPELAICGRSNVGKSSLAGVLMGAPSLVRVSRTPGRTRLLNYFLFALRGAACAMCDLPGYGYAKLPRQEGQAMRRMMADYLARRREIAGVVLVVDARHEVASPLDVATVAHLRALGRPLLVVGAKWDAVAKSHRWTRLRRLALGLAVDAGDLLGCSARSGEGIDQLRRELRQRWVAAAGAASAAGG